MPHATATDDDLSHRIDAELPALRELRRDLHAHPQLGYEETYTAAVVQRRLGRLGIDFAAGIAETGIVAWLIPPDPEAARRPAIALRADMDALPIEERTGLPHASRTPGLMHACGHDGHTAILLGAGAVLAGLLRRLPRPVKLIFQPAEEGGAGAARMIEQGALAPRLGGVGVERVFGLHGWPELPLGRIATRPGPIFAANDVFRIVVRGRGGHAAAPHRTADPITAAAHLITAIQTIVSRSVDPARPAVLTVGSVRAGTADNIIPDTAELSGTIRAVDDATLGTVRRRLADVAHHAAAAMGCEPDVRIEPAYPVLVNDPRATDHLLATAAGAFGESNACRLEGPVMAAEDFAFYGREVPTCFALLGLRPADREDYPGLHTPHFDFNDDAIAHGVRLMCRLALSSPD